MRTAHDSPRDRLLARRSQLLHRFREATALADEATAEPEIEAIDRSTEQWDARVLSRLGDSEQRQLNDVLAALDRVAAGTYGKCIRCTHRIEVARLHALPEAAMCNSCATHVEHRRHA